MEAMSDRTNKKCSEGFNKSSFIYQREVITLGGLSRTHGDSKN